MKKITSCTAVILCLVMLCTFTTAYSAWDGFVESETMRDKKLLVNAESLGNILNAGAAPASDIVKNGRYSAHWRNHVTNSSVKFTKVTKDWSDCSSVVFDMYSGKATGAKIAIIVYCEHVPTPGTSSSYNMYEIPIDWKGWKTFEIALGEFTSYNYADFAKVTGVNFAAAGWGMVPNSESDLYITSLYGDTSVIEGAASTATSMLVSSGSRKKVFEALGNTASAVMNFADNALIDGEVIALDRAEKVTTSEGVSFAPVNLMKKLIGAEVTQKDRSAQIAYSGKNIDVTADTKSYTLSGEEKEFAAAVFEKNGSIYVPLLEFLEVLGIKAETAEQVTVINGSTKMLLADETIAESAKMLMCARMLDAEKISAEDWKELKDKWREYLVGNESNNLEDEHINRIIASVDAGCKSALQSINTARDKQAFFGNAAVTTTNDMTHQYSTLYKLAEAYGTYGSSYYKDAAVKRHILNALDWLYENLYGLDEIEGKGWRSTREHNWYDWLVGTPTQLCNIILIMEEDMPSADIAKYLYPYDYLRKTMRTGKTPDVSAARVYCGTLSTVLQEDAETMQVHVDDYNSILEPSKMFGSGVQQDDVYKMHDYYAYGTAYGTSILCDRLAVVESILADTAFEIGSHYKYNSCIWMYETFEPLLFNGLLSSAQAGRSKGQEENYTTMYFSTVLNFVGAFGKDDDYRLKQILKRGITDDNRENILKRLSISQITKLKEILNDETIKAEPYYKSKLYYAGDSLMHHRGDFGFALSMSSSRVAGWESINGQNLDGWYQGDGMLYMYVKGDSKQYDSTYWRTANPYHMPGTTVDTQQRTEASILNSAAALTNQDFVGMVKAGDEFSVAAMQLEGHKNDVGGEISNYNGAAPIHYSSLMAKKAWFMFDDEVVALGTDITAGDGFDVQTVVENRKLYKSEKIDGFTDEVFTEYKIKDIISSGDDGNFAENAIDGDYETRWSAEGEQWVVFELEDAVPIGYVGAAQYNGNNGNPAVFDLDISLDGENWTTVWSGKSSGTTNSMEAYDMKKTNAKYVRYNGHGRETSGWNSVTEIKIYPPSEDGSMKVDGEIDVNAGKIMGTEVITVDGNVMEKQNEYTLNFTNPKWMHIEGTAGYYFPDGGKLTLDKTLSTAAYVEAWFEHGKSPKNGNYSYVLLPGKTAEETESYSENPDIEIISNTKQLQAVKEKTLGILGMVFWNKGSCGDITVSEPMLVTDVQSDIREISVSDPTYLLSDAEIVINGENEIIECDERMTVTSSGGKTVIKIDFENAKGKSLTVKIKNNL